LARRGRRRRRHLLYLLTAEHPTDPHTRPETMTPTTQPTTTTSTTTQRSTTAEHYAIQTKRKQRR
jgi:hypothetical protein